jgi:hypothetical protein
LGDKNIGNGGLSLRRKSKMIEIINNCKYDNKPEDIYFSLSCPNIYRNIPSFEDAKKFSVETVYNDISFGVHKPWIHLKKEYIMLAEKYDEPFRYRKNMLKHLGINLEMNIYNG